MQRCRTHKIRNVLEELPAEQHVQVTEHAHGRMRSPSARYAPARKPAFATSSVPSLCVWSCHNIAMRRNLSQDVVRLALTIKQARLKNSPARSAGVQLAPPGSMEWNVCYRPSRGIERTRRERCRYCFQPCSRLLLPGSRRFALEHRCRPHDI